MFIASTKKSYSRILEQESLNLAGSGPSSSYGVAFEIPLLLNCSLLIYTTCHLVIMRDKSITNFRTRIFCMILLALLARCSYEAKLTYDYHINGSGYMSDANEGSIFYLLDNLPILLLISIICIFTSSWHRLYLGFKSPGTAQKQYLKSRLILPILNILLYSIVIALAVMLNDWRSVGFDIASRGILIASLLGTAMLVALLGRKLEDQAIKFSELTQFIDWQSSKFKLVRVILVSCCLIKIIQLSIALFSEAKGYSSLSAMIDSTQNISSALGYFVNVVYTILGYVGESGSFLCLICLLNTFHKSAQAPMSVNSE